MTHEQKRLIVFWFTVVLVLISALASAQEAPSLPSWPTAPASSAETWATAQQLTAASIERDGLSTRARVILLALQGYDLAETVRARMVEPRAGWVAVEANKAYGQSFARMFAIKATTTTA